MVMQNNFNRIVEQSTLTTKYANIFNKEIKEFNLYINGLNKIQDEHIIWNKFIIKFSRLVPDMVNLYSLDIRPDKILITGFSSDRNNLKELQENLEASGLFSNIEIPLNDLIKKENIDFSIKAEIKLDQL
jgi:Tfp pilus assembly protein PilN